MFIVTKTQSNGFTHPVLSATTNHHYILTYIVLLSSYSIFQVSRSRPCKQVGRWSQLWSCGQPSTVTQYMVPMSEFV